MQQLIFGLQNQPGHQQDLVDRNLIDEIDNPSNKLLLVQIAQVAEQVAEPESTAQFAIGTTESSEAASTEDVITLNFQATDINALINLVSRVTKKSFIVDSQVKEKITLVSGSGVGVGRKNNVS